MKFKDMPSFGLWVGHPQSSYEGYEELEKIKDLPSIQYLNESEVTYGCIDIRRSE